MTRFDGALTKPDEPTDSSAVPASERPSRPILIEISAAILIVGGSMSLVATLATSPIRGETLPEPILALFLAINVLTIVVGVLIRRGRAWVLALNVVAIGVFLDLTAFPSPIAILYFALDTVALFALIRHRWWFDWRATDDEAEAEERGA